MKRLNSTQKSSTSAHFLWFLRDFLVVSCRELFPDFGHCLNDYVTTWIHACYPLLLRLSYCWDSPMYGYILKQSHPPNCAEDALLFCHKSQQKRKGDDFVSLAGERKHYSENVTRFSGPGKSWFSQRASVVISGAAVSTLKPGPVHLRRGTLRLAHTLLLPPRTLALNLSVTGSRIHHGSLGETFWKHHISETYGLIYIDMLCYVPIEKRKSKSNNTHIIFSQAVCNRSASVKTIALKLQLVQTSHFFSRSETPIEKIFEAISDCKLGRRGFQRTEGPRQFPEAWIKLNYRIKSSNK